MANWPQCVSPDPPTGALRPAGARFGWRTAGARVPGRLRNLKSCGKWQRKCYNHYWKQDQVLEGRLGWKADGTKFLRKFFKILKTWPTAPASYKLEKVN
jgi:hypothetical protein